MTLDLWEGVCKRAEMVPRRYLDWGQWWQSEEWKEHRLYLGSQGTAWDECHAVQICDNRHKPYPELSVLGPYLKVIKARQGERHYIDHPHLLNRHPPLYFDGLVMGKDLVYVDLERAYWSIYSRASLDVAYDGLHSPEGGNCRFLCSSRLGSQKLLRNALLGSLRRRRRRGVDHGTYFQEEVPAAARRPNLWGLVMDVLEAVAWDMRMLGAVYVHTDGFIFPHRDLASDGIERIRDRYSLVASERAWGAGIVAGLGRWKIGEISHGNQDLGRKVDSMTEPPGTLADELAEWCKSSQIPNDKEMANA